VARAKKPPAHEGSRWKYHPERAIDNAKAIAAGDLQVLVDYMSELGRIVGMPGDAGERARLIEDRATCVLFYATALAAYLTSKGRGRPQEVFTGADRLRALAAAQEYEAEFRKGRRSAKLIEKEILVKHDVSREILRAARKDKLPPTSDIPGFFPRARK
jgi:hypothetical protein